VSLDRTEYLLVVSMGRTGQDTTGQNIYWLCLWTGHDRTEYLLVVSLDRTGHDRILLVVSLGLWTGQDRIFIGCVFGSLDRTGQNIYWLCLWVFGQDRTEYLLVVSLGFWTG